MPFERATPRVRGHVAISCGRAGVSMKRIGFAAFWVTGLGIAYASRAGVITSIQRLDTDDV
jgi:hypothetical protein